MKVEIPGARSHVELPLIHQLFCELMHGRTPCWFCDMNIMVTDEISTMVWLTQELHSLYVTLPVCLNLHCCRWFRPVYRGSLVAFCNLCCWLAVQTLMFLVCLLTDSKNWTTETIWVDEYAGESELLLWLLLWLEFLCTGEPLLILKIGVKMYYDMRTCCRSNRSSGHSCRCLQSAAGCGIKAR